MTKHKRTGRCRMFIVVAVALLLAAFTAPALAQVGDDPIGDLPIGSKRAEDDNSTGMIDRPLELQLTRADPFTVLDAGEIHVEKFLEYVDAFGNLVTRPVYVAIADEVDYDYLLGADIPLDLHFDDLTYIVVMTCDELITRPVTPERTIEDLLAEADKDPEICGDTVALSYLDVDGFTIALGFRRASVRSAQRTVQGKWKFPPSPPGGQYILPGDVGGAVPPLGIRCPLLVTQCWGSCVITAGMTLEGAPIFKEGSCKVFTALIPVLPPIIYRENKICGCGVPKFP